MTIAERMGAPGAALSEAEDGEMEAPEREGGGEGEGETMDQPTSSLQRSAAITGDETSAEALEASEASEERVSARPDSAPSEPLEKDGREQLRDEIVAAIKTCYDPEIPVDIYELGLIYEIDVRDAGVAYVKMTLTSPMCPVAEILPAEVEEKVRTVKGVSEVDLDLVWDPPWDIEMMSESARLELNF